VNEMQARHRAIRQMQQERRPLPAAAAKPGRVPRGADAQRIEARPAAPKPAPVKAAPAPQPFTVTPTAVQRYGVDALRALNSGAIDPARLKALVPGRGR
jgi:hypothetical protein